MRYFSFSQGLVVLDEEKDVIRLYEVGHETVCRWSDVLPEFTQEGLKHVSDSEISEERARVLIVKYRMQ